MSEEIFVRFARKPFRFDEVIAASRDANDPGDRVSIAETMELSEGQYDAFTRAPLRERDWLAGKGGYLNLKRQVVEVTTPGRQTFYVDPSGSNYGRYVGLRVPTPSCRYPEVRVYLMNRHASRLSIIGQAQRAAMKAGVPKEEIKAFIAEASGVNRARLDAICRRWFDCI